MPSIKKVTNALKQAAKVFGPGQYSINDKLIACPHCENTNFELGEAQLNTALKTFVHLDWLDESATILLCTQCSQIQWFGKRPKKIL